MDKPRHSQRDEGLAHEAADWVERLNRSGDSGDEAAFLTYLRESPRNVQELLLAQAWDEQLGAALDPNRQIDVDALVAAAGNVVSFSDITDLDQAQGSAAIGVSAAAEEGRQPRRRALRWTALAAAVAFVALGLLHMVPSVRDLWRPGQYQTSVGEQRSIELDDGSVIALNTQSAVRVAFSAKSRDVYLNAGQAMFTVAKDAERPFRVHAGDAVVQAIGTKFDVRRNQERTKVAVIEGHVQVTALRHALGTKADLSQVAEHVKLAAGEGIDIQRDGSITPPARIDPLEVSAWRQRRLVFRNDTLAEIADEFSRYNRAPQIRVEGDALRAQRIPVAVFDADDPESLIVFLASDTSLIFERNGDELIIRRRVVDVQSTEP